MVDIPGTVSQILWHFTGGPTWNENEKRQNVGLKPAAEAYKALIAILRTRELRLGNYKEVVKVHLPETKLRDPQSKTIKLDPNRIRTMNSAPVCCLADIPIMHLSYHAGRYGKFAIGFHRRAAISHGFNPVFYTLQHSDVIRKIREGLTEIRSLDLHASRKLIDYIESTIDDSDTKADVDDLLAALRGVVDDLEESIATAKRSSSRFLAFVKTFDGHEFQTVYCEREWRSIDKFSFTYDDVAMIVLPEEVNSKQYFKPFVSTRVGILKLPPAIPIVPWETLVES